jgi:hypothetical protein
MSAITPFVELRSFRAPLNRPKVIMVLQAYFDESGTSGTEPITVISGFIGTEQTWLKFDEQWRSAILNDLRDISFGWFHMVECENGTKQFAKWREFPEVRRRAARTMAEVIVKSGLTGFWASVDVEDWKRADPAFREQYPASYHVCFEDCLDKVAAWVSEFAPGESVEIIFAEHPEYEPHASIVYQAYRRGKPRAPLKSLRFAAMPDCAPLQAADMAVYCTNKQTTLDIYGKDTSARIYRTALDTLWENDGSFTGVHRDGLSLGPLP